MNWWTYFHIWQVIFFSCENSEIEIRLEFYSCMIGIRISKIIGSLPIKVSRFYQLFDVVSFKHIWFDKDLWFIGCIHSCPSISYHQSWWMYHSNTYLTVHFPVDMDWAIIVFELTMTWYGCLDNLPLTHCMVYGYVINSLNHNWMDEDIKQNTCNNNYIIYHANEYPTFGRNVILVRWKSRILRQFILSRRQNCLSFGEKRSTLRRLKACKFFNFPARYWTESKICRPASKVVGWDP